MNEKIVAEKMVDGVIDIDNLKCMLYIDVHERLKILSKCWRYFFGSHTNGILPDMKFVHGEGKPNFDVEYKKSLFYVTIKNTSGCSLSYNRGRTLTIVNSNGDVGFKLYDTTDNDECSCGNSIGSDDITLESLLELIGYLDTMLSVYMDNRYDLSEELDNEIYKYMVTENDE